MNTKELKEIIKECVREVLREELTNIGKNYVVENYTPKYKIPSMYDPVLTPLNQKPPTSQNPNFPFNSPLTKDSPKSSIEKILEQTAREASMDPSKLGNYL